MRFAAIADIHGNFLALEAVLADIRAQGIDDIVNLGAMVSGPLEARQTLETLMALDAVHVVHVLGNHDACYAVIERRADRWQVGFRHVPYDHEQMAALARRRRSNWAQVLATGWMG